MWLGGISFLRLGVRGRGRFLGLGVRGRGRFFGLGIRGRGRFERVVTSRPHGALLSTPKLTTQSQNAKVTTTYKQYIFVLKTMVVFFEIL